MVDLTYTLKDIVLVAAARASFLQEYLSRPPYPPWTARRIGRRGGAYFLELSPGEPHLVGTDKFNPEKGMFTLEPIVDDAHCCAHLA